MEFWTMWEISRAATKRLAVQRSRALSVRGQVSLHTRLTWQL
uniref:Uncharacterized protein n=1 Tax=Anguilla anguilla TaxID=7936 RepID=A0A0E9VKD0_ANGAN